MADLVAPFQGERYTAVERLSRLIAPPYDVIDPAERARYAALDPDNIVHVMLPEAPPGRPEDDRYRAAAERLATWRGSGVLTRDPEPVLYVLAPGAACSQRWLPRDMSRAAFARMRRRTPGPRPTGWR
jgi:uncharacterized protein (DUF1015 family)